MNTTTETFKVKGGRNPQYTILRTEAMLPNTAREAVKHGKESVTYFLQGITRTGKKSSEVIMCFRFNDGKFLKVF